MFIILDSIQTTFLAEYTSVMKCIFLDAVIIHIREKTQDRENFTLLFGIKILITIFLIKTLRSQKSC
ncbi:hypothetical protein DP117_05845 [Brasilonema sp. UFV-L1]|nr:hypothetical protein [Brasilonema sp. UFV-L1]